MKTFAAGLIACALLCVTMTACVNAYDSSGSAAADFKLNDLSGRAYQLSSYRGKQPVLLFFWTTWCPFCLQSMQVLNRDYASFEQKGIELFGINAGERRSSVERLARNYNIKYTILLDEESTATDKYRILGVPTYVLIGKDGRIIYKGNSYPADDLEQLAAQ
ncbi:MAG: TlpA family protein disulfide reductase [Candidatus Omnitrophica bacterium]|jgi:peroxiredoxin|nr:TlpA family protein disulfide reductase [Candidatus Omnitrophota bacterium]